MSTTRERFWIEDEFAHGYLDMSDEELAEKVKSGEFIPAIQTFQGDVILSRDELKSITDAMEVALSYGVFENYPLTRYDLEQALDLLTSKMETK